MKHNIEQNNDVTNVGDAIYQNIINLPSSVLKGVAWAHFLPSHVNYGMELSNRGIVSKFKDDSGYSAPFYSQEKPLPKEFSNHVYGKIINLGTDKSKNEDNFVSLVLPQYFATLFAGCATIATYVTAVQEYGYEALIPLAVTNAISAIHESNFSKNLSKNYDSKKDKKYNNLEDKLD